MGILMKLKKQIIIILLILALFSSVSIVCAQDSFDNMTASFDDAVSVDDGEDVLEYNVDDAVSVDDGEDVLNEDNDIIYVDCNYNGGNSSGSEENPYVNLKDAFKTVSQNKTVYIKNGNYILDNNMEFNNGFSIVGESKSGVVIDSYYIESLSRFPIFNFNLNHDSLSLINLTLVGHSVGINAPARPLSVNGDGNFTISNCVIKGFTSSSNNIEINVTNSKIIDSDISDSKSIYYKGYGIHYLNNVILPTLIVNAGCNVIASNIVTNKQITNRGNLRINNSMIKDVQDNYVFYNDGGFLEVKSSIVEKCNFRYLLYENNDQTISILNYNNFVNNNIKSEFLSIKGDNDNLDYNWWDSLEKPYEYINNWTICNSSYQKNKDVGIFNVEFRYGDGIKTYEINKLNPEFDVLFKSSLLTLDKTVLTEKGILSLEFIPKGDSHVDISYGAYTSHFTFGNIYVDSNFEGEELGTADNPYKTIKNAIFNSNDWQTIFVNDGVYSIDDVITISKSINIVGQSNGGVILTGGQKGIFTTPTFMGSNIFIRFTNLTFKNVICDSTHTTLSLSPVFVESLISNCIFDSCSGQHGSLSLGGSSIIENCKFLGSQTTANDGGAGAIYFNGGGTLKVENTMIFNTKNSAEYMYGVIYANDANGIISMNNCSISNTTGIVLGIINTKGLVNVNSTKIYDNNLTKSDDYANSIICVQNSGCVKIIYSEIYENHADNLIYSASRDSNVTLNYNSLLDNKCQLVDSQGYSNLDSNWWGTNNKPNDSINNWVVMDASFRKNFGALYINVFFNRCFDGSNYYNLDKNLNFIDFDYNLSNQMDIYHYANYDQVYLEGLDWIEVISGSAEIRYAVVPDEVYVDCNWDGEEVGTFDKPFKTIRAALNNTPSLGIVYVKNGNYQEDFNGINLYKVNVIGESKEGVIVSLTTESTIRFVNLTFNNITFTGIKGFVINGIGGNSLCTFDDCNFENVTSYSGGVEYILDLRGGLLNVNKCNFSNHDLTNNRCILHCKNFATVSIRDTVIDNIKIEESNSIKGLIYVEYSTVDINNLTIINCNVASDSLIYNEQYLNIKNSKIINNTVNGISLIYAKSNSLTIESSIISDNVCSDYLVCIAGGQASLNYNLIKNNFYNVNLSNNKIDIDYNFWDIKPSNVEHWIILDANCINDEAIYGEEINVTVFFKSNNTSGEVGNLSKLMPDDIEVVLSSEFGDNSIGHTKDGNAIIAYKSNIGDKEVSVSSNGQQIIVPISLKSIRIDLSEIIVGESAIITVNVPGKTGSVTLIIDNKRETIILNDGIAQKTIENVTAGNHVIKAFYPNDSVQGNIFDIKEFSVDKLESHFDCGNVSIRAGDVADIFINSDLNISGQIYADVNGNRVYSEVKDGVAHIYINNLSKGIYEIFINYAGNYKYLPSHSTVSITVNGIESGLSASVNNIYVGETAYLNIDLNNEINGIVEVVFNNNSSEVKISEGKGIYAISNLKSGIYNISAIFRGNDKFLPSVFNTTFSVSKKDISNDLKYSIDMEKGTTKSYLIIDLLDAEGILTIKIDGKYNQEATLTNGYVKIFIGELSIANHTILFDYNGSEKYYPFTGLNKTITISKIVMDDNVLTLKNFEYSINLNNASGDLTVLVDNNIYKTEILVDGKATIHVSGLKPGNHIISLIYSGDDRFEAIFKNITVNVAQPVIKLTGNNLNMLYSSGSKYKVKLTSDGKALSNQYVTFVINKVQSRVKTDGQGYASIKIDLPPKNRAYAVSASYNGIKVSNKVKVKSIITAKDFTVKKSRKVTKVKFALKKVNGKFLKGKTLKLKFKGKTYKAKTNKKGVATFKLQKKVFKKLKVGKKYSFKVTYGKDVATKKFTIKK